MTKFLRLKAVIDRTGLSRSTIYERISAGDFPKPVKVGQRAIAFAEAEVDAWARQRLEAREVA